ncbi:hypothetical protein KC332_g10037 [Hortaea werneckii]|uniref:Uncharacterized protein n=1 Tax=Hortaea werneckii TaxID=91943 RepID=A0A3M7J1S9_HORWE|nr:hypothetical protein KC358_g7401 [Hortaea werneckii]KAI6833759.1 hypothetical protein KC350_g6884 [Hortaea werneckii]KAI6929411.1 hypothetical protein KC348_g7855 [Hortaea werneckii]KAI6933435.1 hypothetical protein KC341_g8304 [Hortaea werneckii]KAI6969594.1 hypothetical protein KC321_g7795 [Hortaea werneckii]
MSGRDDDSGGLPHEIFEQMKASHEKWMRELEDEGWRFRQHRNGGNETRPPAMQTDRPPLPNTGDHDSFFVSFKHFVDNSLGSLADSFKSLPSNIQELRANVQKEEGPPNEPWWVKDWRRWTGRGDTPEDYWLLSNCPRPSSNPDAWQAATLLLRQAHEKNRDVEPSKIIDLYRDYVSLGELENDPFERLGDMEPSWGWGHLDLSRSPPSTLVARGSAINWRWLGVDWFKRSMYSPFNLETHHLLKNSGHNWRAAFEDLLCASLDKPMNSNEQYGIRRGIRPYGVPQSTSNGPALDWMLSLQCRGILPPQLPTLYGSVLDGVQRKQVAAFGHQGYSDYTTVSSDSPIGRDMAKLAGEIATPGPEAQLQEPQQPQAELDLYLPPHNASPHESSKEEARSAWFREQQRCDAEDDLWDSLHRRDVDAAAQCMSDWRLQQQRRIGELFGFLEVEDMQEFMPTLSKALQKIGMTGEEDGAERLQQEAEALGLRATETQHRAATEKKVDVLSSLTTTQTTRMPDGTVTTKVVLKQRFADGREETEEKLHTYHDPSQLQQAEEVQRPEQVEKKKGWFWS